jgi:hypothetical protein
MEIRNPLGGIGSGIAGQIAIYTGAHITAGDALLTDNGTTLEYTGIGGITTPFFNATSPINAFQINAATVLALPFGDTTSIAVGISALVSQSAISLKNIAIGHNALSLNTTGSVNVAIGPDALYSNTTGSFGVAIGSSALLNNTVGNLNVAIGNQSLYSNTTGGINVAIGNSALHSNTTGGQNIAVGANALFNSTTSSSNIAIGGGALYFDTTGTGNIAIGTSALQDNVSGNNNTAIGTSALFNNTSGLYNSVIGGSALYSNTTGGLNVAFGTNALYSNVIGSTNVAIGYNTLHESLTDNNVAIGYAALYSDTTGGNNVAIGYLAGYAGTPITSGNGCVFIGYNSGASGAADTNEVVIGANTTGAGSNTAVIGNVNVTDAYFGSSTGASNVHGAVYYSGGTVGITQTAIAVGTLATKGGIVTTFTGVSDERLKISTPYEGGLDVILGITPIRYRWNELGQEWTGLGGEQEFVGFSANNVQKSLPEAILSTEGKEQYLSFDDRPIIAALVNAIKELTARIAVLEAR